MNLQYRHFLSTCLFSFILFIGGCSLKLYINGDLVHSKTSGLILNTLSSSGISIGESFNANGYWNPFNGKIDDVAIYGRALSETEMKSLFNSQGLY